MTQVNMQQVKELRDRTQAGLNDCRSALVESAGDAGCGVGLAQRVEDPEAARVGESPELFRLIEHHRAFHRRAL